MINDLIIDIFTKIGHVWRYTDKEDKEFFAVPDEKDLESVLDSAAAALYSSGQRDQFSTGGLIVEKADKGFDVYVYVGNYQ